jgi:hypothetical protein
LILVRLSFSVSKPKQLLIQRKEKDSAPSLEACWLRPLLDRLPSYYTDCPVLLDPAHEPVPFKQESSSLAINTAGPYSITNGLDKPATKARNHHPYLLRLAPKMKLHVSPANMHALSVSLFLAFKCDSSLTLLSSAGAGHSQYRLALSCHRVLLVHTAAPACSLPLPCHCGLKLHRVKDGA